MENTKNLPFQSALLQKAIRLGLQLPDDLEKLAVVRGCRYYDVRNEGQELKKLERLQLSETEFTHAELAIALLSPEIPESLLRMASAMLSAPGVDPGNLAKLAEAGECSAMVRWIANCGQDVEPDEPFWQELLAILPEADLPERPPHPTRLMALSGIMRGKVGEFKQWIRPGESLLLAAQ